MIWRPRTIAMLRPQSGPCVSTVPDLPACARMGMPFRVRPCLPTPESRQIIDGSKEMV
jgi:hypothetical protein